MQPSGKKHCKINFLIKNKTFTLGILLDCKEAVGVTGLMLQKKGKVAHRLLKPDLLQNFAASYQALITKKHMHPLLT